MTSATKYEALRVEQTGAVLHIALNRPQSRNAMSLQMVQELQQALREAEGLAGQLEAVRVVVLRGEGEHFCAGADLKDLAAARMQAMKADDAVGSDPIAEVNAAFGQLCVTYARSPLAVVAVLEGTVMGGGIGLACVADVAIASETASFRLPETALGVVPAQIAPFLVERIGYSHARRLGVTGGRLDAAQALKVGLVHSVVARSGVDDALREVLSDILACAPGAVAATKALMERARWQPAASLVTDAAAVFSQSARSEEGLEGTTAFLQKRQPRWAVA